MRRATLLLCSVAALILAGCGTDGGDAPGQTDPRLTATPVPALTTPASPSPTSAPTDTASPDDHVGPSPVAGPATTDESTRESDGSFLVVTDLRVGGHGSFDRLVFELGGDGDVGYRIAYDDDPRSQGSGEPVEVHGDAVLRVTLQTIAYPGDAPEEPREGPDRIEPGGTSAIVEVLDDTLYEGHHDFFVGLDEERPYRVAVLAGPQRVVIDIETD